MAPWVCGVEMPVRPLHKLWRHIRVLAHRCEEGAHGLVSLPPLSPVVERGFPSFVLLAKRSDARGFLASLLFFVRATPSHFLPMDGTAARIGDI